MKKLYIITLCMIIITSVYLGFYIQNKYKENNQIIYLSPSYISNNPNENPIAIINQSNINNKTYTYIISVDTLKESIKYTINNEIKEAKINNNEAKITINANEKLTLLEIPKNSNYIIKQETDNYETKTLTNENLTNTYEDNIDNNNIIIFNNTIIKQSTNPNTSDSTSIALILLSLSLITITLLKQIKVKKYN